MIAFCIQSLNRSQYVSKLPLLENIMLTHRLVEKLKWTTSILSEPDRKTGSVADKSGGPTIICPEKEGEKSSSINILKITFVPEMSFIGKLWKLTLVYIFLPLPEYFACCTF